jgi:hypothetical protein
MKIKGTSVAVTFDFVKSNFPDSVEEWLGNLPESSRTIFKNPIISMQWYPFFEGMIFPTETIGRMFYQNNMQKASYEIGKFSAEKSLKGVYKIFVRIASTSFVLKRTSQIFNTYYDSTSIEILEQNDTKVVFKVSGIKPEGRLIFNRIAGWMEKTIEIVNNKPIQVDFTEKILENNTLTALITAEWN